MTDVTRPDNSPSRSSRTAGSLKWNVAPRSSAILWKSSIQFGVFPVMMFSPSGFMKKCGVSYSTQLLPCLRVLVGGSNDQPYGAIASTSQSIHFPESFT
jgi:hypothetical protein